MMECCIIVLHMIYKPALCNNYALLVCRAQLSAGQQEQQQLRSHMALLQEAQAQAPTSDPLRPPAVEQVCNTL